MTLGILLAAVFLAIVALLTLSRNGGSWNMKIAWLLAALSGLAIIIGVAIYTSGPSLYEPEVENDFWGISLDATRPEIKSRRGEPETQQDDLWVYRQQDQYSDAWSTYIIRFENKRIRYILYRGADRWSSPTLQGVRLYDSAAKVRKTFGEPSHVSSSDDGFAEIYSYSAYQVFFWVANDEVSGYGIYNPATGPVDFDRTVQEQLEKAER
jgi:hypothetical protein